MRLSCGVELLRGSKITNLLGPTPMENKSKAEMTACSFAGGRRVGNTVSAGQYDVDESGRRLARRWIIGPGAVVRVFKLRDFATRPPAPRRLDADLSITATAKRRGRKGAWSLDREEKTRLENGRLSWRKSQGREVPSRRPTRQLPPHKTPLPIGQSECGDNQLTAQMLSRVLILSRIRIHDLRLAAHDDSSVIS